MKTVLGTFVYSFLLFAILFEGVGDFREALINDWLALKQQYPEQIFDFLNLIKDSFLVFLEKYTLVWNLRFILMWFPNINPYIQPFYTVVLATQPYLNFIRANLPTPFGWDLSFLVAGVLLEFLRSFLPKIQF